MAPFLVSDLLCFDILFFIVFFPFFPFFPSSSSPSFFNSPAQRVYSRSAIRQRRGRLGGLRLDCEMRPSEAARDAAREAARRPASITPIQSKGLCRKGVLARDSAAARDSGRRIPFQCPLGCAVKRKQGGGPSTGPRQAKAPWKLARDAGATGRFSNSIHAIANPGDQRLGLCPWAGSLAQKGAKQSDFGWDGEEWGSERRATGRCWVCMVC